MANKRITQFPEILSASTESILPIVENGVNYKIKKGNLFTSGSSVLPLHVELLNSVAINIAMKDGEIFDFSKQVSDYTVGEQFIAVRNGYIANEYPTYSAGTVVYGNDKAVEETLINNLFLNVENYDLIEGYEPKILFTRYKPKNHKKKDSANLSQNFNSKSGYKINQTIDEFLRPNRIPITSAQTFMDFGQEYYFKISGNPRGLGKNIKDFGFNTLVGYIYFELRVTITIDGNEYISKPMKRFKLECRPLGTAYDKAIVIKEI